MNVLHATCTYMYWIAPSCIHPYYIFILSSIQEMTYECVCTPSRLPLFPLPPTSLGRPIQARTATATPFLKRRVGDRPLWARGGTSNHINAAQLWSTGSLLRVVWRMFAINHPYLSLLPEASLPSHISMDMLHPWCLQKNKRFSIHRERERDYKL